MVPVKPGGERISSFRDNPPNPKLESGKRIYDQNSRYRLEV